MQALAWELGLKPPSESDTIRSQPRRQHRVAGERNPVWKRARIQRQMGLRRAVVADAQQLNAPELKNLVGDGP